MKVCANCEAVLNGPFCAQCGQKQLKERISVKTVLQSAFESITNVERGFWFTLRQLFYQPGVVAREYLSGKRKLYYNPLRYLILIVAVNTIIMVTTGFYDRQYEAMQQWQQGLIPEQAAEEALALEEQKTNSDKGRFKEAQVQEATKKFLNIIALLALPFIGFVSYLGFRKRSYNYAEHLAINAFWNAQSAILGLSIILITFLFPAIITLSFLIIMLINIGYYTFGYRQLFDISYGKAFLKSFTTLIGGFLLFYITTILLTIVGITTYMLLFD